jgi:hypothetical protein
MPFAVSQLQQLEVEKTPSLPAPTPRLESGDDKSKSRDFEAWLTQMSDLLYNTEFSSLEHFLTILNRFRDVDNPDDVEDPIQIAYKNWNIQSENILFKIASGLSEMQSPIRVYGIEVYEYKDDLRYEIDCGVCTLRFFSLDEFRKAGFDQIDAIKTPPLQHAEYIKKEVEPDTPLFDIVENLQANGYDYLRDDKSAWIVPLSYLAGTLIDEMDNHYIPIVLKRHTKKTGEVEIQLGAVLSDEEWDENNG